MPAPRRADVAYLPLTPVQAAALDRLLDVYVRTDDTSDPGLAALREIQPVLACLPQDHAAYDAYLVPRRPQA